MYIDVIVPNFDDSAEDVIISAWYKRIGDKISKGEVIADVESESVTCGITSGYDCILYRVVAREGQTVQQGMKIAVIDTEAGLENPDVMAYEERKIAQEILEHIPTVVTQNSEPNIEVAKASTNHSTTEEESKTTEKIEEPQASQPESMEAVMSFSEQAEEQFINILKDVEVKAQAEAEQLKANILHDAENQANIQGVELKEKILKDEAKKH
jgi:pyruvate/2-oxoglutarate dehydrogenase complex dihydrolipoamide acyltransferase (E2) component